MHSLALRKAFTSKFEVSKNWWVMEKNPFRSIWILATKCNKKESTPWDTWLKSPAFFKDQLMLPLVIFLMIYLSHQKEFHWFRNRRRRNTIWWIKPGNDFHPLLVEHLKIDLNGGPCRGPEDQSVKLLNPLNLRLVNMLSLKIW